ncbi:MAG: DUF502 domain-containing protein [Xanthomonadaceae bacterium]|nr:DUF502 domain-containing protein [Xanthomonadaceae bacterium]
MKIIEILRKNFLTGVIVFIPMVVIFWISRYFVSFLWDFIDLVPSELRPESEVITGLLVLGITVAFAIGIALLGLFSKFYFGKKFLEFFGEQIQRIPVVGTIYSSLDQLLKTLATGGGKQFSRVVYIEYPRVGVWAVAFVTGPAVSKTLPDGYLNVFIPTVPNPTSGFHLIVKETEVKETHLKVEEAFKLILSLGIAQPTWKN